MRIRRRIQNVEKLLPPAAKKGSELQELESVIEWLVQNNKEFMECVRQLFRLQCKTGKQGDNGEKQYQEQMTNYNNRINELIEQNKRTVIA